MSYIELDIKFNNNGDRLALCGRAEEMGEPHRRHMNAGLMKAGLPWVLVRADEERAAYDEQQKVIASLTAERDALKARLVKVEESESFYINERACALIDCSREKSRAEAAEEALRRLNIHRREMRQLLKRLTKYVVEDRAVTPGKTRLDRLTAQVVDYLQRMADPRDILRAATAPPSDGAGDPRRSEMAAVLEALRKAWGAKRHLTLVTLIMNAETWSSGVPGRGGISDTELLRALETYGEGGG